MKNEMKIGEILPFGFKKIKCVAQVDGCKGCFFDSLVQCEAEGYVGGCDYCDREDNENVFFQIVEE